MPGDPRTLAELFEAGVRRAPRPDRFLRKSGGAWSAVSTEGFAAGVRRCAAALAAAGIRRGDRVALLSYNRLEWAQADYACQLLGAVDVPVYAHLPAEETRFILRDCGARFAFAENEAQAAKAEGVVERVVSFQPGPWEDFLRSGREVPAERPAEGDLATLIYTSGTTGEPKGVMLSHRNLVSNVLSVGPVVPVGPDDLLLSFLPLAHSFERIADYVLFWTGACIAHAESVERVPENLLEVRPTVMAAVPRFYEMIQGKVRDSVAKQPPWRRAVFEWARGVGARAAVFSREGRPLPWPLAARLWAARRLVLDRVRARVGGRLHHFISGGSALARDTAEFFDSLGLPILEGYGLSETSPVLCINRAGARRPGTVGPPIPGVELRIAGDGEILARGPNIMMGYLDRPAETAGVLRDGWFATGDVGELDAAGYLRITDRKKDLFKTSGGKYVAPQPIENLLKRDPRVRNAVVVGSGRKFPSALLVPTPGCGRDALQEAVDAVNRDLEIHERIRAFALVESDFTLEAGEITPTLKVKRRVVEKKHAAAIDALYAD